VAAAKAQNPPDLIEAAVRENVKRMVEKLRNAPGVLAPAIAAGKLLVMGARYDLDEGSVSFDLA